MYLVVDNRAFYDLRDGSPSLKEMQEAVQGRVERVGCVKEFNERNIDMWVNENGLNECLPLNMLLNVNQEPVYLVGNILFTKCNEEGETVGLDKEDIRFIMHKLLTVETSGGIIHSIEGYC